MAVSTNLGLYLPTREDYISVKRDLSDNYEIIDESAGMLEKGIAIVVNGDTAPRAISSGDYLFIKNHSTLATGGYHATANIANGAAITSSNVSADSDGVINAAYASLNSIVSNLFTPNTTINDISIHDLPDGFSYGGTGITDAPENVNYWFSIKFSRSSTQKCQIVIRRGNGNAYVSTMNDGTWNNWLKLTP